MRNGINFFLKNLIDLKLSKIEEHFSCDVIWYFWEMTPTVLRNFRDFIEELKQCPDKNHKNPDRLVIVLNTPWWSAEAVEKIVDIIRYNYKEVYFIVPDYAMSAWTIFCMSWDKIYMDYTSSLWPIDPQIYSAKENRFVPALWYLDKVEELVEKSKHDTISPAEMIMIQTQDLAMLKACEQAKNLSIKLLQEWLVKYKFKEWQYHSQDNSLVTQQEKEKRAEEIANILSDNKERSSHGRYIKIDKLEKIVKLKIDDYSNNEKLSKIIREYHDLITEYIGPNSRGVFLHSRYYF